MSGWKISAAVLMGLTVLSSPSWSLSLKDLGGEGVKEYVGLNQKAWVYRTCKVIVMGTKTTPVVYFSIADSHSDYSFWTYSQSFMTSQGGSEAVVTASDSMNLVYAAGGFPDYRAVYKNVGEPIDGERNIAEVMLEADGAGRLKTVSFRHLSPAQGKALNEIVCDKLKQTPIR